MNLEAMTASMRIFALEAMAWAERKGREVLLQQGQKILGEVKREQAVDYAVTIYKAATASTPLAAFTFDDDLVRQAARKAIDTLWGEAGELINRLGDAPVLDAEEFEPGKVE